jgi:GTP-binding protein
VSETPPRVVVVGRPNVGKSSLFNRLIRRRRSLVHDLPGMTRDVIEALLVFPDGGTLTLVDTGGFDPADRDAIPTAVRERALAEIRRADLVLLTLDASAGILPADREAARIVRRAGRRCLVVANKVDRKEGRLGAGEAVELGFGDPLPVSAEHDLGIDDLLEGIVSRLPALPALEEPEPEAARRPPAVALVGRPNVGKSSLLNALVGAQRTLVSEIAGTTRDSVDLEADVEGRRFLFVDTAGIRRKGKTEQGPEVLSVVAARNRLERCDVAVVVFDASQGPSSQDATVASYAVESGKGIVLAANKWDIGEIAQPEEFRRDVYEKFPFARFAPLLFVSALTGRGIAKLGKEIGRVADNRWRRVPTGELNRTLGEEARRKPPLTSTGRNLKVLYVSQTGTAPPVFTLTASRAARLHFSEERRLENVLRRTADFEGVPLTIRVTARGGETQMGKSRKAPARRRRRGVQ